MKLPFLTFLACCWCLLICGTPIAEANEPDKTPSPIHIGMPMDVLTDYKLFMRGRDVLSITDFSGPHSRRDVVEVVLIQQALALGGAQRHINLVGNPTYRRILADVNEGILAGSATSAWLRDLQHSQKNVYISDATIEDGKFEAGFYTSQINTKALNANTRSRLKQLTAVSNRYWVPDWTTLTNLRPKRLIHIQDWKTMVRNVNNKRADFLLAPFQQTEEMKLKVDGMTLVPIEGVKIGLAGSRHFAISKRHPEGKALFTALQKGLKILKQRGMVEQAYRESGFYNERTRDWLMIK